MTTRREYAASLGLAKAGARGKFSTAAREAIAKAEREGVVFSDTNRVTTVSTPRATNSVTKETGIIADIVYTYPEDEYIAKEVKTGKLRSMREACNVCRVSLVGHGCENPTIVATDGTGSVSVTIEKR